MNRSVSSFAFILFVCTATAMAQDTGAQALLAKHTTFVGWKLGDPSMSSWRASGTRTDGKGATDRYTQARRGLAFRDTVWTRDDKLTVDYGFTGTKVWSADENGYTVTNLNGPARRALDLDVLLAEAATLVAGPVNAGTARVRGVDTQIVRITPPGGVPMDIYEDPSSGAFLRAVIDPGGARQTVEIGSYLSAVAGKNVVGSYDAAGKHVQLTTIQAGASVGDAELMPPKPRATWTFANEPFGFDVYHSSQVARELRVIASINGHSGEFLLDSGVGHIILFEPFASRAGLQDLGTSDFSDLLGNHYFEGYSRVATLSVGNNELRDVIVERINDPNSRLAGVLGYDFFAGAIVNISQSKAQMQLLDPATYSTDLAAGAFAFPVDLTNHTPQIEISLKNGTKAYPRLDTGSSYFMLLSQALRDSGKIAASDSSIETANANVGMTGPAGTMVNSSPVSVTIVGLDASQGSGRCVIMANVYVGPYTYQNPPLCFVNNNYFSDDGGLIGLDFLKHFDIVADYPHAHVILTPNNQ
ncbi:MAG: retropepsin-like domain-containing protein [Candidatus Eremiobacteraeota bacterium]|nr:retropepsin-like domain-containing protein [Candidatus Eremiobacteraeota bacterium]